MANIFTISISIQHFNGGFNQFKGKDKEVKYVNIIERTNEATIFLQIT